VAAETASLIRWRAVPAERQRHRTGGAAHQKTMDPPTLSRRGLVAGSAAVAVGAAAGVRPVLAASPPAWRERKKYQTVDGIRMAYYEVGAGDPIVFLHGNPTSSYLWRNVIPHVEHLGRCIAPDLVGMGDSQKLPDSGPGVYTLESNGRYLFGLLDALGVDRRVVLVLHDWGSALGFHWAHSNEQRVRGIAYMESLLRPPGHDYSRETGGPFFLRLRSPEGERAVLQDNEFLQWFFRLLDLYLSDEDRAEYLRPFRQPGEDRRPTLAWPRQLPIAGVPEGNARLMSAYSAWLAGSRVPKLFVEALPGLLSAVEHMRDFALGLPNQKRVRVYGAHYVQEVSAVAIGRALAGWIPTIT
jgi:haloalkane dehalogenase